MSISGRKNDHIEVNLHQEVQSDITTGLEDYRLIHEPLPEVDFSSLDISTDFLGKKISAPFLISSMTGGTESGELINRNLLEAAQQLGIPFAMGSQRIYLEDQSVDKQAQPRSIAPDIPILSNIGAVQLNYGFTLDHCQRAIEQVGADALILHLNPLQEVLQNDGDTNFSGLLKKVGELCNKLPVPVVAKEVGWGINAAAAARLVDAGVKIIDVAGAGGTSWARVESEVSGTQFARELAEPFFGWGIPTAECITQIHACYPDLTLIASGGICNGIEAAKAIYLGARICGLARVLLPAAAKQDSFELIETLQRIIKQYKIARFVSSGIEKVSGE